MRPRPPDVPCERPVRPPIERDGTQPRPVPRWGELPGGALPIGLAGGSSAPLARRDLPGVHRLARVDGGAIAAGHLRERLLAGAAAQLERGDGVDLPAGAVAARAGALGEDLLVAGDHLRVGAERAQPLHRLRDQMLLEEVRDPHPAHLRPAHPRLQAPARALLEGLVGLLEAHPRPQRPPLVHQRADDAVEERGVRGHVRGGRAGRQQTVLQPQVGHVRAGVVDRPVPAPHGAVVEHQLVQAGGVALGQQRLLRHLPRLGDQRREQAHVLLEEVEHRGDPALPEPHPRPHSLRRVLGRARVQGLHEGGDAGLVPQPPAQQERGVRGERDLWSGDRLRRVPGGRELLRRHLQVQLHRGARALRRDRVEGGVHTPALALDPQGDLLAAGLHHAGLQRLVAGTRGAPRLVGEEILGDRGQMADGHHARPAGLRRRVGPVDGGAERRLQLAQPGPLRMGHREVRLEVEPPDLVDVLLVVEVLQQGVRDQRRGHRVAVGEVHLQLDAHRPLVHELGRVQEGLEEVEIPAQLPPIAGALGTGVLGAADLASHGVTSGPDGCARSSKHARARCGRAHPPRGRWRTSGDGLTVVDSETSAHRGAPAEGGSDVGPEGQLRPPDHRRGHRRGRRRPGDPGGRRGREHRDPLRGSARPRVSAGALQGPVDRRGPRPGQPGPRHRGGDRGGAVHLDPRHRAAARLAHRGHRARPAGPLPQVWGSKKEWRLPNHWWKKQIYIYGMSQLII